MPESSDLHDLVTEVRLIRAELEHQAQQAKSYQSTVAEIFERLRKIENTIAVLHAAKPSKANAWAVAAVIISGLVAFVTLVNEISTVSGTM